VRSELAQGLELFRRLRAAQIEERQMSERAGSLAQQRCDPLEARLG
jgi:hypothetical protein